MGTLYNGCTTVNCGEIQAFNNTPDPMNSKQPLQLEIMPHTRHNPNYNIIAYYYLTKTDKGTKKVAINVYKNIHNNKEGCTIYLYDSATSLQHYYSRNYPNFIRVPAKYYDIVKYIHPALNALG